MFYSCSLDFGKRIAFLVVDNDLYQTEFHRHLARLSTMELQRKEGANTVTKGGHSNDIEKKSVFVNSPQCAPNAQFGFSSPKNTPRKQCTEVEDGVFPTQLCFPTFFLSFCHLFFHSPNHFIYSSPSFLSHCLKLIIGRNYC